MLYTETDLEESMDKIETINFHEVKEVAGVKFWCYHAGHVLGAAMFMIEIAGVKVNKFFKSVVVLLLVCLGTEQWSGTKCTYTFSLPKLLYTGDFSRQEDRHLMAAEIPSVKPDILIIVCPKLKYIMLIFHIGYLGYCMADAFMSVCRSQRTAHTSMRRGRSVRLASATRFMTS